LQISNNVLVHHGTKNIATSELGDSDIEMLLCQHVCCVGVLGEDFLSVLVITGVPD
jgi:hypothetical protein